MLSAVKSAFDNEMAQARKAYYEGDTVTAIRCLERSHIIGQRYFSAHLLTHWWMFKVGVKRRDRSEIIGQILRLIAVFPAYLSGWVPRGNTGGANVSALRPMPLPKDLNDLLDDYVVSKDIKHRLIILSLTCSIILLAELYFT